MDTQTLQKETPLELYSLQQALPQIGPDLYRCNTQAHLEIDRVSLERQGGWLWNETAYDDKKNDEPYKVLRHKLGFSRKAFGKLPQTFVHDKMIEMNLADKHSKLKDYINPLTRFCQRKLQNLFHKKAPTELVSHNGQSSPSTGLRIQYSGCVISYGTGSADYAANSAPPLILILGEDRVGKSTAARELARLFEEQAGQNKDGIPSVSGSLRSDKADLHTEHLPAPVALSRRMEEANEMERASQIQVAYRANPAFGSVPGWPTFHVGQSSRSGQTREHGFSPRGPVESYAGGKIVIVHINEFDVCAQWPVGMEEPASAMAVEALYGRPEDDKLQRGRTIGELQMIRVGALDQHICSEEDARSVVIFTDSLLDDATGDEAARRYKAAAAAANRRLIPIYLTCNVTSYEARCRMGRSKPANDAAQFGSHKNASDARKTMYMFPVPPYATRSVCDEQSAQERAFIGCIVDTSQHTPRETAIVIGDFVQDVEHGAKNIS